MDERDQLDELLVCRLDEGKKVVEPCSIVIFGASGDLTVRKLVPALFHLHGQKQMPEPFRIIGFARREKTTEQWREEMKQGVEQFSRTKKVNEQDWEAFAANVIYSQGEFSKARDYLKLKQVLANFGHDSLRSNLLFYLAVSPSQFAEVVEHLHNADLLHKNEKARFWQRLVVEKPFGHDLASAR